MICRPSRPIQGKTQEEAVQPQQQTADGHTTQLEPQQATTTAHRLSRYNTIEQGYFATCGATLPPQIKKKDLRSEQYVTVMVAALLGPPYLGFSVLSQAL